MNHVFSLVWNRALHAVQVASELARPRGGNVRGMSRAATSRKRPLALACAAAIALGTMTIGAMPGVASAAGATYIVTSATDAGDTSATGSLSWAIAQANANGGGTIEFQLPSGGDTVTETGGASLPAITTPVTFTGASSSIVIEGALAGSGLVTWAGTGSLTVDGANLTGGFVVATGNVNFGVAGATGAQVVGTTGSDATVAVAAGWGGDAMTVTPGAGTVNNYGSLTGGVNGFMAEGTHINRGHGGAGLNMAGGVFTNAAGGAITGGAGSNGAGPDGAQGGGGIGGYGVNMTGGTFTNDGGASIAGGHGGDGIGVYGGYNGGAGVNISGGAFTNASGGTIMGGMGGANGGNTNPGGLGVNMSGGTFTNAAGGTITGGDGGSAGSGGGGGGNGGVGAAISGGAFTNGGSITGGDGASYAGGVSGSGGYGGAGVTVTAGMLSNSGSITGGVGGQSVTGFASSGAGVVGTGGATVINEGTISGGKNADGTFADAIEFSGGGNTLGLVAGNAGTFIGAIAVTRAAGDPADTLQLGGDSGSDTFDLSQLAGGAEFGGFNAGSKTGTSTWTLEGTDADTSTWDVAAGTLVVGDASHASTSLAAVITVASGATLSGFGSIGGLDASGTVSPGATGTPGTFSVTGDVAFEAGSTFNVDANADGSGDKLAVTGTTTIKGGNTVVLSQPGNWAPQTTYTLITSGGGVTGQFAGVSDNQAFLIPTLTYDPNDVKLTLSRNQVSFPSVGTTLNQKDAATGIEGLGFGNELYDAVVKLTAADAQVAFDQTSGEFHASQQTARIDDSRYIREAMNQRLDASDNDPEVAKVGHLTAWAHGWGHWGSVDGDGNAAKLTDNGDGLLIGADLPVATNARIGFTGGASRNSLSVHARNSWGRDTSTWLGAYGGVDFNAFSLRGGIAYAWDQIPTNRQIAFPGYTDRLSGNATGHTLTGFVEGAWTFHLATGTVSPFLNLAHTRLTTQASTEQGGAAALHVYSSNEDVSFSTLGARGQINFANHLDLHGELGWQHAFGDTTPNQNLGFIAGGPVFTEYGVPIAKNAASGRVGLGWHRANVAVDVDYKGLYGSGVKDNAAKLSVSVMF